MNFDYYSPVYSSLCIAFSLLLVVLFLQIMQKASAGFEKAKDNEKELQEKRYLLPKRGLRELCWRSQGWGRGACRLSCWTEKTSTRDWAESTPKSGCGSNRSWNWVWPSYGWNHCTLPSSDASGQGCHLGGELEAMLYQDGAPCWFPHVDLHGAPQCHGRFGSSAAAWHPISQRSSRCLCIAWCSSSVWAPSWANPSRRNHYWPYHPGRQWWCC